jgi:hypothetical protein
MYLPPGNAHNIPTTKKAIPLVAVPLERSTNATSKKISPTTSSATAAAIVLAYFLRVGFEQQPPGFGTPSS